MVAYLKKVMPITLGLILSLMAITLLVESMDKYDGSGYKFGFIIFALLGFPALFFGINKLSE